VFELVVELFFDLGELRGCKRCEVDWEGAVSSYLCAFEGKVFTGLSFWGGHFCFYPWGAVGVELLMWDALFDLSQIW
jgi:hypothetical protein